MAAVGQLVSWRFASGLLLVLFSIGAVPGATAGMDAPPALRRAHLEVIYSSSLFRTASKNDAIAAMRVWVDTVGRQKGFQLDCSVSIAENVVEMKKLLQAGTRGLVLVDPLEYFELADLGLLEPAFVGVSSEGESLGRYLLVASQSSGVTTIPGLRGKTLVIETGSRADLGRRWVEVMLHENGLEPADIFFSSLSSVSNPSAAVLPVFFGKTEAAVVDKLSFGVMKEMNPQLGLRLRVLAESPALLLGILCVDKRHVDHREKLMEALRELHQDAAGRQILLVFKSNRLIAVNPQALERVRSLWAKSQRIYAKTPASKTAATDAARRAGGGIVRPGENP